MQARKCADSGPVAAASPLDFGRMYLDEQQQTFGYGPAAPLGSAPAPAGEPFRAGRYVILHHVGHGAMGNVYAAYDPDLDRKVAVKVLRDSTRGRPLPASLDREARAMAKLTHPHVVTVYDVGSCDRGVFVAMEFVDGLTLRTWLKAQVRSWREVLAVFVQAGQGLAAAHAAGVIHHDFKPDNVLVGAGDRVKVADFGLARVAASTASTVSGELIDVTRSQDPAAGSAGSLGPSGSAAPTQASERGPVGTLAYMAPERHLARPADARSDQFSFCVALYEALYQQRPFTGVDVAALRRAVLHGAPADPPRGTPVPARVAAVLRRGLARAPEDRYPTMDTLLVALAEPAQLAALAPRRLHWTLSAGLLLGAAGAMTAATRGEDRCLAAGADEDQWWRHQAEVLGARFPGAAVGHELGRLGEVQATWAVRKRDNCEAGQNGRLAPDLRRAREACLDRRMAELRAIAVQAGEARRADEAAYLLAQVAATDGCDDQDPLTTVTPPPPEQAAAVLRERQALAGVAGLEVAGQYGAALRTLASIERNAEALGHAPLLAEVLYQRARLEHYRGDSLRARETLAQAIDHAEAHRHDRLAADAWGFLVEIAALPRSASERGTLTAWHRRARAAQARLHGDRNDRADRLAIFLDEHGWTPWRTPRQGDPQQVHPLLMQGLVHLRRGEAALAARNFDDALAEPGLHPRTRAKLLLNRAVAVQEQVDEHAATRAWDEAVAAFAAATWPGHPAHAEARVRRGEFLQWKGRFAEARVDFAAALPALADVASHASALRTAHTGVAIADLMAFRVVSAATEVRAALAAGESLPPDPLLASAGFEAELLAGSPDQARLAAAREVALFQADGDPLALARAETHLGEALAVLGDSKAARAQLGAALQRFTAAGAGAAEDTAYAHKTLGLLALRERRDSEAETSLTRALALWDTQPCGCRDAAEARLGLATLLARRDDPRAAALGAEADAFFSPLGDEALAHRDRVAAWIDP